MIILCHKIISFLLKLNLWGNRRRPAGPALSATCRLGMDHYIWIYIYIYIHPTREVSVHLNLWYPHRLPKTYRLSVCRHTNTITFFTRYPERLVQIQFAESSSCSLGYIPREHGVYIYIYIYIYIYVFIFLDIYKCTYIYIYIYTHNTGL